MLHQFADAGDHYRSATIPPERPTVCSRFPQGETDDKSPHDITDFEILFWTAGMRVVAFDAGRCDSDVGIDRFKDLFRTGRHGA